MSTLCYNYSMNKKSDTYHHGNLKEELISIALEMIENEGVEKITLRELGSRVGTSRSAIYRHFSSKNDLIQSVFIAGFEKLDKAILPSLQNDEYILTRLFNMGKEYINFAIKNPNIYRLLFGNNFSNEREESCDIEDKEIACGFHYLVAVVVQAQEKKLFKKDDPMKQAFVIHAMIHGVASMLIDNHSHIKENLDEIYKMSFDTLSSGMLLK
ncbi:MAG: TetR family transcriptional regulator [Helicobacteraceae bacterium]|nr:TetR family transcriptional regulator [Helicobacteraceae bacterium]